MIAVCTVRKMRLLDERDTRAFNGRLYASVDQAIEESTGSR